MITDVLNSIDSFVWGPPLLVLLIGTGVMLTIRLQLIQFFKLPQALKLIFTAENKGDGDIDSFKALCTALAATVGTGNIVGVATAIHAGGPGAVFWMWIAAFVGMATKYAEGCLAVKFRTTDENGDIAGGPMYYIERGLGEKFKPLAKLFAIFGVLVAFFGIGTFAQVNSIVEITKLATDIPVEYTAVVLTVLVAAVTIGGLQSISRAAAKIVPAMAVLYIAVTVVFLIIFREQVPSAIMQIITDAFTPTAAVGGFAGATVMLAMRNGVARGVFSNESGLGSAPIVAAAAKTKWSAEQGLVSMTGTFIDTIIICTLTGLVIVISGAWTGDLNGWNYYGERCINYLVGVKGILPYRIVFIILVACGAFLKLDVIWILADIVNGLMAIPNLVALIGLSGVVVSETKLYFEHVKQIEMKKETGETVAENG